MSNEPLPSTRWILFRLGVIHAFSSPCGAYSWGYLLGKLFQILAAFLFCTGVLQIVGMVK